MQIINICQKNKKNKRVSKHALLYIYICVCVCVCVCVYNLKFN